MAVAVVHLCMGSLADCFGYVWKSFLCELCPTNRMTLRRFAQLLQSVAFCRNVSYVAPCHVEETLLA